jgi:hypothetical protein
MKPVTDIAIVPRQPRWPVRLDPVAPPSLRKVVRDTASSTTTEPTMEPITEMEAHPITDTDMEAHPLADIFPKMSEVDLATLAADIKKNGLLLPIFTYKGQILDGRHRYKPCQIAGIEPRFEEFTGDDPVAFVDSMNDKRRHLTTAERKKVAAEILKWHPEMSDRAIAKETGLSAPTVGAVRREVETSTVKSLQLEQEPADDDDYDG